MLPNVSVHVLYIHLKISKIVNFLQVSQMHSPKEADICIMATKYLDKDKSFFCQKVFIFFFISPLKQDVGTL